MSARFIPLASIDVSDWQSLREVEVPEVSELTETAPRPFRAGDRVRDTNYPERGEGVVIDIDVCVEYPVRVVFYVGEDEDGTPGQTYTHDGRWWHDEPPSLIHID